MNNREIADLRRRLTVAERELRTQRGVIGKTERQVREVKTDSGAVLDALVKKSVISVADVEAEKVEADKPKADLPAEAAAVDAEVVKP